jgi:hypothetical protein
MSAATAAATAAPVFASSKSAGALQLRARGRWDDKIPLRPLVRAYLLVYASAVAPRVLTLLLQHLTRWKHAKKLHRRQKKQQNDDSFLESLERILRGGLDPRRFPTFCAALVGGSTLLEVRLPLSPPHPARTPLFPEQKIRSLMPLPEPHEGRIGQTVC